MGNMIGALTLLLAPSALFAEAPAGWDARLTDLRGQVSVFEPGSAEGLPAVKGMPLEAGDRVATGPDSSAEIGLEGGSALVLGESSDFTLQSESRMDAVLNLKFGILMAKISKLLAGRSLQVRTETAVAAVRGTEFAVEIAREPGAPTHVGVFDEGKVEVRGQSGAPEMLASNQETSVLSGGAPAPPSQMVRFAARRGAMRTLKVRARRLTGTWKALSPDDRKALRQSLLRKMRAKREELREKGRRGQRERERLKEQRENRQRLEREKMEKRREKIRRGMRR